MKPSEKSYKEFLRVLNKYKSEEESKQVKNKEDLFSSEISK